MALIRRSSMVCGGSSAGVAITLAPAIDRCIRDPVLLGDLRHRCGVGLAQDLDHLFFAKPGLLHGSPVRPWSHLLKNQLVLKMPGTSAGHNVVSIALQFQIGGRLRCIRRASGKTPEGRAALGTRRLTPHRSRASARAVSITRALAGVASSTEKTLPNAPSERYFFQE